MRGLAILLQLPFFLFLGGDTGTVFPQQSRPIAITHAVLVDGNGGTPIEDGSIVIRGAKIDAVGPAASVPVPADAQVMNVQGRSVLPGLADMHVHLTGGWDGVSVDLLGYRRYLNALLYAGITTVLDMGNVQPYVLQLKQEVAAGRLLGPRIYCAGALLDAADAVWPPLSYTISSAAQVPKLVQQQKRDGVDVLKAYVNLSVPLVAALVTEGKKVGLRVFVDQGRRNGSVDVARTGMAAWAHTPVTLSDDGIAIMKEQGILTITTLAVFESFSGRRLSDLSFMEDSLFKDTSPPWFLQDLRAFADKSVKNPGRQTALENLRSAERNVRRIFEAGLMLAAGTDAPYPGDAQGEGLHRELELLVEAGLTPLQAITLATKNAATLVNAAGKWGTLVPGGAADIVIIDGRPDRKVSDTRKINTVIREGKVINRQDLKFDSARDPGFRVCTPALAIP